jgi:leucyl-tRNA synthetase
MGFDSVWPPARRRQYAIQTGHSTPRSPPSRTSKFHIKQLSSLLQLRTQSRNCTSDASYYKWTQWIFLKLFNRITLTPQSELLTDLTARCL